MANTIRLKDYTNIIEEYTSNGAITPGIFVMHEAAGTVAPASASYDGVKIVAVEDILQGKGIDDDYATGTITRVWVPRSGDIVNAIASAAITNGSAVATATGGKVVAAGANPVIGEAITAAALDGDRIQIRIK